MLFLVGAVVGVFASQDLLLFYVFFEAMLIPIYVLVGVWGGPNRIAATVTFVIYTMAGSLLMLASIVVFGLSQGTFSLIDSGTSGNDWVFLGFLVAFAVKAPLLPFHGWLRTAYTEAPPEVAAILSGVVSKAAVFGLVWIVLPHFPGPVDDWRTVVLVLAAVGLLYGSLLAFRQPDVRGVIAYSSMGQMSLIVLGIFAANDLGARRRRPPLGQPRPRLGGDVPARGDADPAHRHRPLRRPRRDGEGPARSRHDRDGRRDAHARRPRLGQLRRRVLDPRRRLRAGLGLRRGRAPSRSCSPPCTRCG